MKKATLIAVLAFALVTILSSAVVAQEVTPEAPVTDTDGNVISTDIDLEGLTADPAMYVGQTVRLEGVIANLINVRTFILGEGAALDDDQILVINSSGEEFDIRVTEGGRFVVTGMVYSSFSDGGLTQIIAHLAESGDLGETSMATPGDAMATVDPMMGAMLPRSTSLAEMVLPDTVFDYTILEVTSADDFQFVQLPE